MEDRIREFDGVTYKDLFLSSIDLSLIHIWCNAGGSAPFLYRESVGRPDAGRE